ncbi:ABC transporter substrate-binding protein [Variovorax arabinosiphilus]|uniref:ABC transporter substrate-binding protein n=1 Tax=Variovorax arabinosiphilus TaxID=3053498 RepID=UPI002574C26F|nr:MULTISPECIES: ABC transporter substrate-binding protein [unclassified Variovorax]MDM0121953.1 ABC transporter substrate-binding protein [Variovorax sp. J2L1-78]MDM0131517.1 ABC transporter substrate-binding protein [Variovorax sp. J2L1-63]MDM0234716.1 ABC transporter substrate-binding protein [Variovorax sp. J2R1-6]
MKRIALAFGVCVAALAHAAPIEVRDALGRTVVLPAPPQRLVTIFASNTELVAALGLVDRIVGVEEYTRFPQEAAAKPKVGGRLGFSVDAVVAQRPDLVIVTPARQAAHQLVDPMERLGVPVIVLLSRSVGEVLDNIRLIGRATGVSERGDALAQSLQVRLDRVAQQVAGRPAPRIVMVTGRVGNGMLLVARSDTYTGEAMVLAGGRFAIAGRGAVAQVSPEAILASNPDVLLFAGTQAALDDLVQLPGWRDMRAVREQRAVTVSRSEFLIPGPRTIDGIESLARWLHPVKASP